MKLSLDSTATSIENVYREQPEIWLPAVKIICEHHGVECREISAFEDGANLVAAVDESVVVKIFPPHHCYQWDSEWRTIKHLKGCELPQEIPNLIAYGECADSWTYVVISRLPGTSLEKFWQTLMPPEKAQLLAEIGHLIPITFSP